MYEYEIVVEGHIGMHWAVSFEGMHFTHAADGTTIISGPVKDQASLHSALRKIRDLGVVLVRVQRKELIAGFSGPAAHP